MTPARRLPRKRGRDRLSAPSSDGAAANRHWNDEESARLREATPFTMASASRLVANIDAVQHVVRRGVPGALVECGVWRGGSALVMIRTLQSLGVDDRHLYLYDTFEGMTPPSAADTSAYHRPALETWDESTANGSKPWDFLFNAEHFNLDQVRQLLHGTGYPAERIHFVVGPVETTLATEVPEAVAVLRLDTDWYESTAAELDHLYPRLSSGGVLIIDDYGHWDGARRAVDEYFDATAAPILLTRIDYTGRMGVKS